MVTEGLAAEGVGAGVWQEDKLGSAMVVVVVGGCAGRPIRAQRGDWDRDEGMWEERATHQLCRPLRACMYACVLVVSMFLFSIESEKMSFTLGPTPDWAP